ncbi:MAG: amidohydrolase family protein [Planctomycetota bacterium]
MKTQLLLAAIAAISTPFALCQDNVAVRGGKIVTITGPTIEDGVILIRNGRIAKIGGAGEVEVSWDATVVDAKGRYVLPTWVLAHTQGGMRGANENMQNVPYVSIGDAVDPASPFFEDCLRNGVGTVNVLPGNETLLGGQGMVLRPYGRTVEDMAIRTSSGIKLSLWTQNNSGRLQQIRKLRRALEDVRDYVADFERRRREFEEEKKAGAIPKDKEWTEEYDRMKKPVADLLAKKVKGWLFVPTAAEIEEALRLAEELDLSIVLGRDIQRGIALLQKLKAPVVLDDQIEFYETDPDTDQEKKINTAKLLADAGIPFALSLGSGAASYPWWQMATCVRGGVDRRTALEAMTIVPARMLGLEDQIGSIAEGKMANLQILTGDPLQATTWVDKVLLEGRVVYTREDDPRLRYLLVPPAAENEAKGEGK